MQAQVGIGTTTPLASSVLDITSTDKGILIPRLTTAQRDLVASPASGLLIFNTDTKKFNYFDVTWKTFGDGIGWNLTGNAGTVDGTNFIGTTDNKPFNIRVNNQKAGRIDNTATGIVAYGYQALNANTGINNTAIGYLSLSKNTTGPDNTAIGYGALTNSVALAYSGNTAVGSYALNQNTTGIYNTANGARALPSNTTGARNTATGAEALDKNTSGSSNTADGVAALWSNTTGTNNTAVGQAALYFNVSGLGNTSIGFESLQKNTANYNTATGYLSLSKNTTGQFNTANGYASLASNTTGNDNTAIGNSALLGNTTGINNTATGFLSLSVNTEGEKNTANGSYALQQNTTGNYNTGLGYRTLLYNTTGSGNTTVGYTALSENFTGSNLTAIGYNAEIVANGLTNATAIGYNSLVGASNSMVLGGTGADQVFVGVGTPTPNSYLETAGSFGTAIITTVANVTLDKTHYTVIVTGGTPTITLPAAAAGNNRRSYRIINQHSSAIAISSYIDFTGLAAATIPLNSKIEVQSNGTNWYRVD